MIKMKVMMLAVVMVVTGLVSSASATYSDWSFTAIPVAYTTYDEAESRVPTHAYFSSGTSKLVAGGPTYLAWRFSWMTTETKWAAITIAFEKWINGVKHQYWVYNLPDIDENYIPTRSTPFVWKAGWTVANQWVNLTGVYTNWSWLPTQDIVIYWDYTNDGVHNPTHSNWIHLP